MLEISDKMYKIKARRGKVYSRDVKDTYGVCDYRRGEVMYILGYNDSVYFASVDMCVPFNYKCGFVEARDFEIIN